MSGLLAGILLSRTVAGLVTRLWQLARHVLAGHSPGPCRGPADGQDDTVRIAALSPRLWPSASLSGRSVARGARLAPRDLTQALPCLLQRLLDRAGVLPGRTCLWVGADMAGLFGVIRGGWGGGGPLAGRMADRLGARPVVLAGAVLVVLAWICFELWLSLAGLACGVILLDLGCRAHSSAHQQRIYGLRPTKGDASIPLHDRHVPGEPSAPAWGCWSGNRGHWLGVGAAGMGLALVACLCPLAGRRGLQPAI